METKEYVEILLCKKLCFESLLLPGKWTDELVMTVGLVAATKELAGIY